MKSSDYFKKSIRVVMVFFGIFLVTTVFGETTTIIGGLLVLTGLMLFVVWGAFMIISAKSRKICGFVKKVMKTRYVLVFKF